MKTHNPDQVALIAACLLHGRELLIEPHHARNAVASARLLLDAAHATDDADMEPEAEVDPT